MGFISLQISETANAKKSHFYFASRSSNSNFAITTGFIFSMKVLITICQPSDSFSPQSSLFFAFESDFSKTENVKTAVSIDFRPFQNSIF